MLLACILSTTGMLHILRKGKMRNRAVVLLYHRVLPQGRLELDHAPDRMAVSTESFRKQMEYLAKHYKVVPAGKIQEQLGRTDQKDPRSLCAITFDDGWLDVYEYVYPVLMEMGLCATVFVTTEYLDGDIVFWEEKIRYYLTILACGLSRDGIAIVDINESSPLPSELNSVSTQTREALMRNIEKVLNELRKDEVLREEYLKKLEGRVKDLEYYKDRLFMNAGEAAAINKDVFDIGSHTVSHVDLANVSEEVEFLEIAGSKRILEDITGDEVDEFAYPYGSYNAGTRNVVKESGYKFAFTTIHGLIEKGDDPFTLKRINIHELVSDNIPFFACRILNLFEVY